MTLYVVKEAKSTIVNTQDNLQGSESPRWTAQTWNPAHDLPVTSADIVKENIPNLPAWDNPGYAEWDVWAWGPSGQYEFEVIKDDLVTKYGEPVEA